MESDRELYRDLDRILVTKEELREAVVKMGRRITEDYRGKQPVMVCILRGASVFFSDLIREIDLPLEAEFMACASYGAGTRSSGEVRLLKDLDCSVEGKDVILVEDIVDTGNTLSYLRNLFLNRGATSLKIASLLDKPSHRKVENLVVDYVCLEIPDAFVVGYGLDYNQRYRNLPDIGVLSPEMYE